VNAPSGVNLFPSHILQDGVQFWFQNYYQRQRAALLEANGNIYAAFGSYCDWGGYWARGWLLVRRAGSLDSLGPQYQYSQLNDLQDPTPAPTTFLSSIWMSGDGPAADFSGNVYFVTGNTHCCYHDRSYNISESAVKVPPLLNGPPLAVFTPGDVNTFDSMDRDFGAGGIMLLPDQSNGLYLLAVVAGKDDGMFLLNRNPGSLDTVPCTPLVHCPSVPYAIGHCWCGESFFTYVINGAVYNRVVSSGGDSVMVWNVGIDPNNGLPLLNRLSQAGLPTTSGEDGGFFTSVSSNGTQAGTGIIWAVTRPGSGSLSLFALNPANLSTLFSEAAAPQPTKLSFIAPVVANGLVFVGAANQLSIFGLGGQ